MQAEGICLAIEAQRSAMPYCMGSLYWQLNDCWPVTSWSSVDYYGKPKALQYALKKVFAPNLISTLQEKDHISVRLIADDTLRINEMILITEIMNFKGKLFYVDSMEVNIKQMSSTPVPNIKRELLEQLKVDSSNTIISFRLIQKNDINRKNNVLASKLHFLKRPKELTLEKPKILIQAASDKSKFYVINRGGLVKNIQLSQGDAVFNDNYFDLLPGETRLIGIQNLSEKIRVGNIELLSLYDCLNP
jgi:beta-mannosidase